MSSQYDLIVIGGGPAGFFGALSAAQANPNLRILILEKGIKLLAKVRISGGGRCNLTHACFDPAELIHYYPRGNKELRGPFSRFQPEDTVEWFKSRGVRLKTEADGRMFPVTDDSETIIDCLLKEAEKLKVEIWTRTKVTAIKAVESGYKLTLDNDERLSAKYILMAAGGGNQSAYEIAGNLGHTIVPPVPSLFTFNIRDPRIKGLAGISFDNVNLAIDDPGAGKAAQIKTSGPLLITHWGLSGPAALKLSAWGARILASRDYNIPLIVNWTPDMNLDSVFEKLLKIKTNTPRQQIGKHPPRRMAPSRLWQRLVAAAGIDLIRPWNEIPNHALRKLAGELTCGNYQIQGKGVFKDEFVTCGGVDLKEVDFRTMESRVSPGLYFAGELLNIDGLTGGFNFQAAWTTGWLAGQTIAKM